MIFSVNGNITTVKINNENNQLIDNLTYNYNNTDNKLLHISDAVTSHTGEEADLKGQQAGNFEYDAIGSMTADKIEKQQVFWTVYGKVAKMIRNQVDSVVYGYDGTGNKILRNIYKAGVLTKTVHYVHDASGNTLAMYEKVISPTVVEKVEFSIYGSSRLGTYNAKSERLKEVLGNKKYELSNHLGNVLAVITDNKFIATQGVFVAQVISIQDYYAYGLPMAKHSFNNTNYLYYFNGKEDDLEAGWQDYGWRDFIKKYRRFFMVDPLTASYAHLSPYQYAENEPIANIDLDGLEQPTKSATQTITKVDPQLSKKLASEVVKDVAKNGGSQLVKSVPKVIPWGRIIAKMLGRFLGGVLINVMDPTETGGRENTEEWKAEEKKRQDAFLLEYFTQKDAKEGLSDNEMQHYLQLLATVKGYYRWKKAANADEVGYEKMIYEGKGYLLSVDFSSLGENDLGENVTRFTIDIMPDKGDDFTGEFDVLIEGTKITLFDANIKPNSGDISDHSQKGQNFAAIFKYRTAIFQWAKERGFTAIRIKGDRAPKSSSAKPGKQVDTGFIDLTK